MRTILSWILTAGGVALLGAAGASYLKKSGSLKEYVLYLLVGGIVLLVIGVFLAREAKVVQHTTMMLQRRQKRNYQIVFRLLVLAAALVAGYFLIGIR